MDLDIVLLWLCLFSAVNVLTRRGALWTAKALAIILAAGALVWFAPDVAGWIVAAAWLVLLGLPTALGNFANRLIFGQRFSIAVPVCILAWLLHPERVLRDQARLVGAMACCQQGAFAEAMRRFEAMRKDPLTSPDLALTADMHVHRLEDRWAEFLDEAQRDGADPRMAQLLRVRALASLYRTDELIALQQFAYPATLASGGVLLGGALAMMALLTVCGRVESLGRLLDGPLRRLGAGTRALQLGIAGLRAGDDAAVRGAAMLHRLETAGDRDIAQTAARVLARPPEPVVLSSSQLRVIAAVEAELDASVRARGAGRVRWRPWVTLSLIGLNSVVFGLEIAFGGSEDEGALRLLGALWPPAVLERGEWWRLGMALFLHLGWVHFGVNMLSLAVIGAAAERLFGSWRTLAIYAASGLGSMAAVVALVWLHRMPPDLVVGASGAIMGLVGGLLAIAARAWWLGRTRATLVRFAWILGAITLQSALDLATPQISFVGHASGAIIGLAIGVVLAPRRAIEPTPAVAPAVFAPAAPMRRALDRRQIALTLFGGGIALAASLLLPGRKEEAEQAADGQAPPSR